jgi:hypothetical protein
VTANSRFLDDAYRALRACFSAPKPGRRQPSAFWTLGVRILQEPRLDCPTHGSRTKERSRISKSR